MSASRVEGTIRTRVRYAETDQMGVVYHANYLVWCEIGRTELMRELGFAYADVEKAGIRLAVAEASVRYGQAARYDDEIRVVTHVEAAQSRTITFAYRLYRDADDGSHLLATASTKLIAIDERGVPRRLPPDLLRKFRDLSDSQ
ncbi:MAG TPA: thioesterase family protein [Longimicrobiales bacterium]|nr:thioesterase family protein [Longimicrobiales bacterium]